MFAYKLSGFDYLEPLTTSLFSVYFAPHWPRWGIWLWGPTIRRIIRASLLSLTSKYMRHNFALKGQNYFFSDWRRCEIYLPRRVTQLTEGDFCEIEFQFWATSAPSTTKALLKIEFANIGNYTIFRECCFLLKYTAVLMWIYVYIALNNQNMERFFWYCSIIFRYALLSSEISG